MLPATVYALIFQEPSVEPNGYQQHVRHINPNGTGQDGG
jgi:hypothetical protein